MKKRAHSKIVASNGGIDSPSAASPSSPSSSSSSTSSCIVDCPTLNHHTQRNDIDEDEKPPKPKRVRKRKSINSITDDKKSPTSTTNPPTNRRSSIYRGVTRGKFAYIRARQLADPTTPIEEHRWTGRFEAHLWDKSSWNSIQNKKGRQVYLGAYDSEVDAARTYDLAALKYWGPETTLNFSIENYTKEYEEMQNASKEEYLASLRRRSSGFSRGVSKYRGVARHHHNGRWEARIGRVFGNKYLYLGTFSSQEEAAAAYDLAAIEYRGANAVTNFDISNYIGRAKNLTRKGEPQPPDPVETKPQRPQRRRQQQKIKQQEEEEEQEQEYHEVKPQALQLVQEEEKTEMPSPKIMSSIDHSSMLGVDGPEDGQENPWNFGLDAGGYDPLLVDIPLEEDGKLLDLFNATGFEDNIDLIFEGEGDFVSMDASYFDGMNGFSTKPEIIPSEDLDKKIDILPSMENSISFSSSSPSSPASTISLVSCQL